MKYENTVMGIFLDRPNRFIAHVSFDNKIETVHVKNTGRCTGVLVPGVQVVLQDFGADTKRKTRYDLIAAKKDSVGWINLDSQAPNKVVYEWLQAQKDNYTYIKPEYTYGNSRIDFYIEKGTTKYLMEIKGCTLDCDGIGYFPDAPTTRGVKHLRELSASIEHGYHPILAFVIQMEHIYEVRPCTKIHPEFTEAFEEAKAKGVEIWFLPCHVTPDELRIHSKLT